MRDKNEVVIPPTPGIDNIVFLAVSTGANVTFSFPSFLEKHELQQQIRDGMGNNLKGYNENIFLESSPIRNCGEGRASLMRRVKMIKVCYLHIWTYFNKKINNMGLREGWLVISFN